MLEGERLSIRGSHQGQALAFDLTWAADIA